MSDNITLPIIVFDEGDVGPLMMANEEQRWKPVDRLLADHGFARSDIPEAWAESPLSGWCWLVLVVNEVEHDPDRHEPLTNFGIDLGFSSTEVRRFIWVVA